MKRHLYTEVTKLIDGVNATTTSAKLYVGGARRIGFLCRRADHISGSTAYSVKISMDPRDTATPTMTACNMLYTNTTNTNSQSIALVASTSLAANGDTFMWLFPGCNVNWIECTVTETTDGTHSMYALVEY